MESLWSKGRKQEADIIDGVCLLHGVLALRNAGILYKPYERLLSRSAQFLQVGPGKAVKAYQLCTDAYSDSPKAHKLLRILIFTMVCCIPFAVSCLLHIDTKQSMQEGICGHQQLSALDTRRRNLQEKHRASNISHRAAAQSRVERALSGISHNHKLTIQQVWMHPALCCCNPAF